jgi:spore coat protein CotF
MFHSSLQVQNCFISLYELKYLLTLNTNLRSSKKTLCNVSIRIILQKQIMLYYNKRGWFSDEVLDVGSNLNPKHSLLDTIRMKQN